MAHSKPHAKNLRKGRYSAPGYYYFLTASVTQWRKIFAKRNNAKVVLDTIRWLHTANRFVVDAAVVMPDHIHWLVELSTNKTLEKVVGNFKGRSARQINRARRKKGRLWQPGFHDHALRNEESVQSAGNYVIYNPVRAGLANTLEGYHLWGAVWIDGSGWPRNRA